MTDHEDWLPAIAKRVAADAVRLFCLPYAGGGASIYRDWSKLAAPGFIPVALRLPGREMRILERPIDNLPAMVDALASVLLPYTAQPYAFFGHSMGALIAYELTLRFLHSNVPAPRLLAVSGRQAPHLPNPRQWESVRGVSDERFVEILNGINGKTGAALANPSLYQLLLPALRADFSLCEDYCPRPPARLPVAIIAFGGSKDPSVSITAVQAWSMHTDRMFRAETYEGDHFFVNSHAAAICKAIERCLLADPDVGREAAYA